MITATTRTRTINPGTADPILKIIGINIHVISISLANGTNKPVEHELTKLYKIILKKKKERSKYTYIISQKLFSLSSVDGVVIDKVVISEVNVEKPATAN